MNDTPALAIGAKSVMYSRLSEIEDALDGFPATVLLDDFLVLEGGSEVVDCRAQSLCMYVLSRWTAAIERDLERLPPATMDVLEDIRQRMLRARDALLAVRSLLQDLTSLAPSRLQSD